jgi:hypothetical protein
MDDRTPADPLTDNALFEALGRTLRVNPSPAFLPRVRARVAQEVPAQRWREYSPVLAALALVLLVGVALTINRPGMTATPPVLDARHVFDNVVALANSVRQDSRVASLGSSHRIVQPRIPTSPNVSISREESAAIARLLQQASRRPFTVVMQTDVVSQKTSSDAVADVIVIPVITIEPLESLATPEGGATE